MVDLVLDPSQQAVVDSTAKAIVLVAGAGSGKTEIVARRIERILLQTPYSDARVLGVSFTVKAADELKARLAGRLGDARRRVDTDTVHGYALSVLRTHGTRVGLPAEPEVLTRDEDRAEWLTEWLALEGKAAPEDVWGALRDIDLARARLEESDFLDDWRAALSARGALDYPAMLEVATELASSPGFARQFGRLYEHLVVDEAQNLTPAQFRFLTALIGEPNSVRVNAMLVGDVRQSIVDFAGGDGDLMARFADRYEAERFVLRTNYRSADRIVKVGWHVARALGSGMSEAPGVVFAAPGKVRTGYFPTEHAEAQAIADWVEELLADGLPIDSLAAGESSTVAPSDIAVMARTASYLTRVDEALTSRNIEVAVAATEDEWLSSRTAKLLVELFGATAAPSHRSVLKRISALSDVALDEGWVLSALAESPYQDVRALASLNWSGPEHVLAGLRSLPIEDDDWVVDADLLQRSWQAFVDESPQSSRTFGNFRQFIARLQRGERLGSGVRVITVHKSQGREFKAVALVACNEGQLPDFRARSDREERGELRTFYVAVTRPTRLLFVTRATSRRTRIGPRGTEPSRYLRYLEMQ